jgi:hypothetical protein
MKIKYEEYQKTIATAYTLLILAFMPLYMKDGFNLIGDAKYIFYRNISLLFVILWAVGAAINFFIKFRKKNKSQKLSVKMPKLRDYASNDLFCIGFGIVTFASFILSRYKDTAFIGFSGWYMGMLTQLLIIWGYFFVKKWHSADRTVWYIVIAATAVVSMIALLNRMEYDPLSVYPEISRWEWNRRNLISTIGNINWYSSFLAVMLPVMIFFFWSGKGIIRIFTGAASFVGIGSFMLQGSMSGYAAMAVMYTVLLFFSLNQIEKIIRFLEAVVLVPIFWFIISFLKIKLILPENQTLPLYGHTKMWAYIIIVIAACCILLKYVLRRNANKIPDKNIKLFAKSVRIIIAVLIIMAAAALILCQISDYFWQMLGGYDMLKFSYEWGGMRGGLWYETIKGFLKGSFIQKIFGAGPDCYARYFYEDYNLDVWTIGMWEDAIYANAHNEWLTMLINEGILGMVTYTGFFVSSFIRFMRYDAGNISVLGMMAVAAYFANNFFSFGQVVSTPLIFLVIALCENECRRCGTVQ